MASGNTGRWAQGKAQAGDGARPTDPASPRARLLPAPTAVVSWRTPAEHMAWRRRNGRSRPCDLQAAILLLGAPDSGWLADDAACAGEAAGRLLPTPDTGTSPSGHGRRGGRPGNGYQSGQSLDAVVRALHQPGTALSSSGKREDEDVVRWGPYEAAIRRWEHVTGRPVPAPAEPGPRGQLRLSAVFTEWLMGIPQGWVTGVAGISRIGQLRILGNGVIPRQGAAALRLLARAAAAFPSDPRVRRSGQENAG